MYIKKSTILPKQPKKSYTEKIARHEPSDWLLFLNYSFDKQENKLDYYRGKDYTEKLCKKLRERVMELVNYKKEI